MQLFNVVKVLIFGFVILVVGTAFLPELFLELSGLQQTVDGGCRLTNVQSGNAVTGGPPVGTTWAVGQAWNDGRYFAGLPTAPDLCPRSGTISAPAGYTYKYIGTPLSTSPYRGGMVTIIQLMPILLVLGVLGWVVVRSGLLSGLNFPSGGGGSVKANLPPSSPRNYDQQ